MLRWFDTREVDALAAAITADLTPRATIAPGRARPRGCARATQGAGSDLRARRQVCAHYKLNLYKKARLGSQFRWALSEAGTPGEFVEAWTMELVNLVTRGA